MAQDSWDRDFSTRPVSDVPVYALPCCTLQVAGGEAQRFFQSRISIGSAAESDVRIAVDTVSRVHAEVLRQGERYVVRDLDSTNGTTVGGVRVREAYLEPGMVMEVGGVRVVFAPAEEVVQAEADAGEGLGDLVGASPAMRRLFAVVKRVAGTDATVLVTGETGTGKEVLARTLHGLSRRAAMPLTVVDCAAIPGSLIESELFGHEKGSFSGAIAGRRGLFEEGNGGTVFLDEVGELPLEMQPKLLRVLETGEVRRVGSNRTLRLDVRVVAATNRNLAAEVEQGRFRSDLYYRLNVIPLRLQPLRERREDIPLLVERILKQARFNRRADGGLRVEAVGEAAMAQLQAHGWPGNVRELVNVLEREVSLAAAGEIGEISAGSLRGEGWCEDAGQARAEAGSGGHDLAAGVPGSYREERERVMKEFEERYFAGLLESAGGSVAKASRLAGVDRKHLRHLLKKRGLRGGGEPG